MLSTRDTRIGDGVAIGGVVAPALAVTISRARPPAWADFGSGTAGVLSTEDNTVPGDHRVYFGADFADRVSSLPFYVGPGAGTLPPDAPKGRIRVTIDPPL